MDDSPPTVPSPAPTTAAAPPPADDDARRARLEDGLAAERARRLTDLIEERFGIRPRPHKR